MWFNPFMTWLLKSPLHGFISRSTMLITVTGRRSGRSITTPVNYQRRGNTLWVISHRQRTWWRNLREGAEVTLLLGGKDITGSAKVIEEETAVAQSLFEYYSLAPGLAKYVGIGLDEASLPARKDCRQAAGKLVTIRIDLPGK
jgi:deazaflavin-dependent oxidoreductase (nitroreductase family)